MPFNPPNHAVAIRHLLVDAREVCRSLGLDEGAKPQARGLLIRCPWHLDRTPSCSVREAADGTIAVKCFGCGASGDLLNLVAVAYGLDMRRDFSAVLQRGAELAGVQLGDAEIPLSSTRSRPRADPDYPPLGEVADLWGDSRPVVDDHEVAGWLQSRALDPGVVEGYGLARALPQVARLPRWARIGGLTWVEAGYRCILPMFDHGGVLRSVRARRVVCGEGPKALPPTGYRGVGLVMADALGRTLLAIGAAPDLWPAGTPLRIVITEGEPDFLTWATAFSDGDLTAPAALGVVSGSWTAGIASRVPDGARVIIRTHHDEAGERYAVAVRDRLGDRCTVIRGGARDCPICPGYGWARGAA